MLKTIELTILKDPRISAKLLCEYAESSAIMRRSILKACKIKSPGIISISKRYNLAEEIISDCLEHSFDFLDILKDYASDLRKKSKSLTEKKAEEVILCAESLDAFFGMNDIIQKKLGELIINNVLKVKGRKIIINGVNISIRPELMLCSDGGVTSVGFVKLCFCKTKPLTDSVAQGIASLGKLYFKDVKMLDFEAKNCIVIDVFANKIFTAPKRDKRLLTGLSACCAEIADRWEKI